MSKHRDNYFGKSRGEVAELIPSGVERVLEIGCGEGIFRSNFAQVREYVGVEPDPDAAAEAAAKLDKVYVGTYEDVAARLPLGYFDLVVCNDVIEHMVDHDWFLDNIRKHMRPSSALLGSIPNVRFFRTMYGLLIRKTWRYADWGVLNRTHLRFFTESSWRQALLDHNYRIESMKGLPESFSIHSRRRRWAERAWIQLLGSDSRFMQFAFLART